MHSDAFRSIPVIIRTVIFLIYRVFPDAQNPAFWPIFNQNDPRKFNQCFLDDAIPEKTINLL